MLTSLLLLFTGLMNPFSLLPRFNFRNNNITLSLKCAVLILSCATNGIHCCFFRQIKLLSCTQWDSRTPMICFSNFFPTGILDASFCFFHQLPGLVFFMVFCLLWLSYQLHLTLKLTYHNATVHTAMYIYAATHQLRSFPSPNRTLTFFCICWL